MRGGGGWLFGREAAVGAMPPVKLQLPGGELRRARLAQPTFEALCAMAQGSNLSGALLQFVDDEGDLCRLTTDAEVEEAVLLAGDRPLRVIVSLPSGGDDATPAETGVDEIAAPEPGAAAASLTKSLESMRSSSQARLDELLADLAGSDSDAEEPGLAAAMLDVLDSPRVQSGGLSGSSSAAQSDPELLAAFQEFDKPQIFEESTKPEPEPEPVLQPEPEADSEPRVEFKATRPAPQPPLDSPRLEPVVSPPAVMPAVPTSTSAKRREVERMLDEAQAEVLVLKQQSSPSTEQAERESPDELKESVSMFIPFGSDSSARAKKPPRRLQTARKATGRSAVGRGGRARGRSAASGRGRGKATGRSTTRKPAITHNSKSAKDSTDVAEGIPCAPVGADEPRTNASDVKNSPLRMKSISPPAQSPTQPASSSLAQKTTSGAATRKVKQGALPTPKAVAAGSAQKKKSKAARNIDAIAARREKRRAAAAAEKLRADTELAEHGGDRNDLEYHRAVRGFRAAVRRGEVLVPKYQDSAASSRLQVFVRVRPMFASEDFDVLTALGRHALVAHRQHTDTQFVFDGIFASRDDSFLVSKIAVQQHLDSILHEVIKNSTPEELARLARKKSGAAAAAAAGKRGSPTKVTRYTAIDMPRLTVFAYGQTGSGKTYTMESITETITSALLQFATDAPKLMAASTTGSTGDGHDPAEAGAVYIAMSSFEIFSDKCYDLLAPADATGLPPPVKAYEDAAGELRLPDLTESLLVDDTSAAQMLHRGRMQRRKGPNAVHDNSSRSHAITQLEVRDVVSDVCLCRFTLVDLAGSERASETMADDAATRQEGAEINKSLLALKECIRALDSSATHTPFRQSKLTQVLRDSLESLNAGGSSGGRAGSGSRAVMIATVSPSISCLDHTLNTLRYADRLKELSGADPEGAALRR